MTPSGFCVVNIPKGCHFTLQNIPFGVFSRKERNEHRIGVAIGEHVLDLAGVAENGLFSGPLLREEAKNVFSKDTLNPFMALGRPFWTEARVSIQRLLSDTHSPLATNASLAKTLLIPMTDVQMHLPIMVGDYTDFYSSKEHATNVGTMFRGKDNALQPNWLHLPVGYHGRASSIVVSETAIARPKGQIKPKEGQPFLGLSQKLDFELEMAFVVGVGNRLGECIGIDQADDHIFGVVLMNDWSARDIQSWEYVPLGPFLGKSFGTVISPWIVTLDALEPFLVEGPTQDPPPLSYLVDKSRRVYDVDLQVFLKPAGEDKSTPLCRSNLKHLYWGFRQQLAHHTINGCNMRTGDLCGTGTISGPTPDSYGSLLELSWNGQNQIRLMGGGERTFLEDGDTIIITGKCSRGGETVVGFGECVCPILPGTLSK